MSKTLLEEIKENLDEVIEILEEFAKLTDSRDNPIKDLDYINKLVDLMKRMKFWRPEVFVYLDCGSIQGASANCNMVFNLWDNDNESERHEEEEKGKIPSYSDRINEWNWMIESGHNTGELKKIY